MSTNTKRFQCDARRANGTVCTTSCSTLWNLKRHKEAQHASLTHWTFIQQSFQPSKKGITCQKILTNDPCANDSLVQTKESPATQGLNGQGPQSQPLETLHPLISGIPHHHHHHHLQILNPQQRREVGHFAHTFKQYQELVIDRRAPENCTQTPIATFSAPTPPAPSNVAPELTGDEPIDNHDSSSRKRTFARISKAREALPIYEVSQSRKFVGQQRAIDWLKSTTKKQFEQDFAAILAEWGVSSTHWGTCVLSTTQWQALSPIELATIFNERNCPPAKSDRIEYQFGDHRTALVRARAWFSSWPHNGTELDNFLQCGPYMRMQASHLCHQHNCLIHTIYEPSDINLDRKVCHEHAIFLRREGRPVPQNCQNPKHNPPCMMQHAALTTYEAYLIQFAILRQAKGLPPIKPPQRPQRHKYNTFEYQLPVLFCERDTAISLQEHDLQAGGQLLLNQPALICTICEKVTARAGVIALWSHIVKKHSHLEDQERLVHEIRRTAEVWREYWAANPNGGGKRNARTVKKLGEVNAEGFDWQVVLGWDLA